MKEALNLFGINLTNRSSALRMLIFKTTSPRQPVLGRLMPWPPCLPSRPSSASATLSSEDVSRYLQAPGLFRKEIRDTVPWVLFTISEVWKYVFVCAYINLKNSHSGSMSIGFYCVRKWRECCSFSWGCRISSYPMKAKQWNLFRQKAT